LTTTGTAAPSTLTAATFAPERKRSIRVDLPSSTPERNQLAPISAPKKTARTVKTGLPVGVVALGHALSVKGAAEALLAPLNRRHHAIADLDRVVEATRLPRTHLEQDRVVDPLAPAQLPVRDRDVDLQVAPFAALRDRRRVEPARRLLGQLGHGSPGDVETLAIAVDVDGDPGLARCCGRGESQERSPLDASATELFESPESA
jgi:hypothetical protein